MEIHSFENLGAIQSPVDGRDYKLGQIQVPQSIPETYMTSISALPIFMQGKKPSCIGHAIAWAMMWHDYKRTGVVNDYSKRFIYALSKRDDGVSDQDGTFYRVALKEAQNLGICDQSQFADDISLDRNTYQDSSLIPPEAFKTAIPRVISHYATVDDLSWNGLKQAIYQNGVVPVMILVGKEMWTAPDGTISWAEKDVLPMRPPAQVVSGHAVVAVGYSKDTIFYVNSWSKDWGKAGIGYFQENYMPYLKEGWSFVELTEEMVQSLQKQEITLLQKVVELYQKLIKLFH